MKPSTQKVLDLLRGGGAGGVTTGQFAAAFCPRASARILELRKDGFEIESKRVGPNAFVYTLLSEPDDLGSGGGSGPAVAPEAEPKPTEQHLFDLVDIDIPKPRNPYEGEAA